MPTFLRAISGVFSRLDSVAGIRLSGHMGVVVRDRDRTLARRKLDVEMQPYRRAGMAKNPTNGLLRAVRQALRVPVAEIAQKLGVQRTAVFDLEMREPKNTISLRSMSRMAQAMGCKVVYGIVPVGGKKLEELALERLWGNAVVNDQLSVIKVIGRGRGFEDDGSRDKE